MTRRMLVAAVASAALVAASGCQPAAPAGPTVSLAPPDGAATGTVERVVDGDTLVVEVGGTRERVRLLRVDAPELATEDAPMECLGEQAAAALERLVPPGTPVALERDVEERDRFGRLLAHLWVGDTWVNGTLLRQGWADLITVAPNVAHDTEAVTAHAAAEDEQLGLWAPGAC